jgi:hypothetical protein
MANLRALALNAGIYQEIQDTDVLETGLINVADGSAAAPSLSFQNDTDMGFYFISAGNLGVSISGSESYRFQAAAFRGVNSGTFRMPPTAGSESDPTYAFYGDPDTGIYSDSADVLKFSTGGTLRVSMDSTSVTADVPFYALDGTSGSPSFSFQSQSNTGFYYRGANQVGYSSNGTARWYADSNLIASETATGARIRMSAGAVGAPTYSFDGDSDTGLFSDTANTLQFAVGGTERLTLNPNGKLTYTAAATEAPLNVTEQSAEPSTNVATHDVYLDDGTNTSSGNPGWRRYNGAGWEDIAASTGLWTDGGGFAYLTETGDSAVIGDSALTGTEKLKVDGGDILLEGGNINIPDSQVAGGNVGVLESNSTPLLRRHGLAGTLYLGNSGNLALTGPSSSVIVGEGAATSLSNSLSASVIIGYDAGQTAGTGVSGGACVIIGYQAAQNVNDVRSSVVIGSNAAQSAGSSFSSNVAIGAGAGYSAASTINNTVYIGALAAFAGGGQQTVIIGGSACSNATAANWGVYLGYNVADNLTTSYYNVAIGRAALSGLTSAVGTGGENVSIGYQSMASSAGGTAGSAIRNVAIGIDAMYRFYGASHYNVAVGWSALSRTSSSDSGSSAVEGTVALGTLAGYSAYDASYSIYIGYNAGRTNHDDYRLYVHSSTSDVGTAALLYGAFDDRELTVNGQLTAYDTRSYTGTTSSVGVTSQLNYSSTSKKAAWYGFHVDADHAGTSGSSGGDAGNYKGVYSDFAFTAATLVTVDSLYAFDSTLDLGANVTISEYRGLSVGSPTGAGTCDKAYGVYIEAQSGSGQVLGLYVDDDAEITGKLTVGGLIDPTGLVLDEQSTVPGGAPGLAKGTVWVRDDTPNVLVFTDDAGTDWDLNVNSSPWTQDTGFIYLTTTTDNVAIGSTTLSGAANEHLYLLDTVEDSLSTGMYVVLEKDEADVKPAWNGVYVQADHTGGSGVAGGYTLFTADLNWNAAQTLNAGYGYQSRVDVSSGGTISTYFGFQAGNVTGAGTIGTSYGLFVDDMGLSSTNAYGIYVQAQTASGTALGLYVDDDAEITGKLTVGGLIDPTGLVLDEQGTIPYDPTSTTKGTVWLRDDNPNVLVFTDNAGTDWDLNVADLWTATSNVVHPSTLTNDVAIGASTLSMSANEHLFVRDDDETTSSRGIVVELQKNAAGPKSSWVGVEVNPIWTGNDAGGDLQAYVANLDWAIGSQTLSSWYGLKVETNIANTSTLSNYYGAYIEGNTSTGVITNAYGLYLEALDGSTSSYGIYQAGDSDINYFAGQIAVNDTSPSSSSPYVWVLDDDEVNSRVGITSRLERNFIGGKNSWTGFEASASYTGGGALQNIWGHTATLEIDNSSSSLTTAYGYANTLQLASGSITKAYGFYTIATDLDDTVGTYYGFYAANNTDAGGGLITNAFGLYVDDQGVSSASAIGVYIKGQTGTLSFGIYQDGAEDYNYFAGLVGIASPPGGLAFLDVDWQADLTTGTVYGINSEVDKTGTDATTEFRAYNTELTIDTGNGTLGTYKGLNISTPSGTSVGTTITTIHGVYVEELLSGPAASGTAYGIYQVGEDDLNYFNGATGFGTTAPDAATQVEIEFNAAGKTTVAGLLVDGNITGAQNPSGVLGIGVAINYSSTIGSTSVKGYTFDFVRDTGTAAITNVTGYESRVIAVSNSISNVNHFLVTSPSTGTATVTNAYGLHVNNMNAASGGTGNAYGIYLEEQDASTLNYGIYQDGDSNVNYFGGQVGINEDTPSSARWLSIVDDSTSSASVGIRVEADFSTAKSSAYGFQYYLDYSGSSTLSSVYGIDVAVACNGTGCSINTFYGLRARMGAATGETISTARVLYAGFDTSASGGTINNAYGLYVADLNNASTTTSAYAVWISNQTASSNTFGIYQLGSATKNYFGGQVGLGTNSPNTSAALEISSTTRALIVSRMTTTQRNALTPVNGMIIYNTSTNQFNFRENGVWVTK